MDFKNHMTEQALIKYAFLWSEAKMFIAALALFLGGMPPALVYNPAPALYGLIASLLKLSWLISGVAAGYLVYQWYKRGFRVFGGKELFDTAALWVLVVTGINLGLAGLLGSNIGMNIVSTPFILALAGVLYVVVGSYLLWRWKEKGKQLF